MKLNTTDKKSVASSFFSGVFILSVSTVIVKIIGLIYKIPMLTYLGAEGMGYFNSAYEIYALLCVISTAGLPTALSMLVSSYRASGKIYKVKQIYKNAFFLFLLIGIIGTGIMIAFAGNISDFIKNENAFFSIIAIAPSLLFVCISSAVRGYFQGFSRMLPTAISQLIEALGKLILGIFFAYFAIKRGYAAPIVAAFAILGISIGTFISAIYLIILKTKDRILQSHAQISVNQEQGSDASIKTLLKIAFPITLGSAVIGITRIIDMTLIMRRLQDIGYTAEVTNEIYGVYTTVAVPIFSLIPSLLTPISMALVPALSAAIEKGNEEQRSDIVKNAVKLTVLFALPSSLAIIIYSRPIISLLFFNIAAELDYVCLLLSLLGSSILFSCMITTTNAILQSYRKVTKPIISMAIGALVKVFFAYILIGIPEINVYGAPISTFLCDLTITVINLRYVYRLTSNKYIITKVYTKPLAASVLSILSSFALYSFIYSKTLDIRVSFVLVVPVAIIAYLVLSFLIKSITLEELEMLPMGDKLYNFVSKIKNRRIK